MRPTRSTTTSLQIISTDVLIETAPGPVQPLVLCHFPPVWSENVYSGSDAERPCSLEHPNPLNPSPLAIPSVLVLMDPEWGSGLAKRPEPGPHTGRRGLPGWSPIIKNIDGACGFPRKCMGGRAGTPRGWGLCLQSFGPVCGRRKASDQSPQGVWGQKLVGRMVFPRGTIHSNTPRYPPR